MTSTISSSPHPSHDLQDEACFFQCEPILGHFQSPGADSVDLAPVCASYCDSWFEACRNDMTYALTTGGYLPCEVRTHVLHQIALPLKSGLVMEGACATQSGTMDMSTQSRRITVPCSHSILTCPTPIPGCRFQFHVLVWGKREAQCSLLEYWQ